MLFVRTSSIPPIPTFIGMNRLETLYYIIDLAGTFVFALSGASAARQRGLDLFGIAVVAYVVACGGGIVRDLCIGAIPPAGLAQWQYPSAAILATILVVSMFGVLEKLERPVILFDAIGLALFAVSGAQKALLYTGNGQVAVLLGVTTAVGGGVLRDVLLNRVPAILKREVYALAALAGALMVVLGKRVPAIDPNIISIIAMIICFVIRILALRNKWNLPGGSVK